MAGALDSLKILDFTTLLPGPYATMLLADMGADVIKIATRSRPEEVEFLPPFIPGTKLSAISALLGRNKKLMYLNLKDDRARKIIHQLLEEYDIVFEQFRPGVMARLNLDYESLRKVNPRVIYCSLTGYGQNGPMRDRAGHDTNYISRSGVASYAGKKESGPALYGIQIADVASGSNNSLIGILASVIYRQNTGIGQHIDISMTDGMMSLNAMQGASHLVDGIDPVREETYTNGGSLCDFYETKDGGYLSFAGFEPKFSSAFFQTIGRPDLIPGGVAPNDCASIKAEIRAIMKTKNRDEWMALFDAADACVEPVLTLSEALNSTLAAERNMVIEVPGPHGIKVRQIANPIKLSETPPVYRHVGLTGSEAGTKSIMKSLGYSDIDIEEFENTGLFS